MTRKPFIGGNWKNNGTNDSISTLVNQFNDNKDVSTTVDVMIAPTALHLIGLKNTLRKDWIVAAQNGEIKSGAFTGEISMDILSDSNVSHVILGHSERRTIYHESDDIISKKIQAALKSGLSVVACIGEKLEEMDSRDVVLSKQLDAIIKGVGGSDEKNWVHVVIAYEPVWAIGTGKTATPQLAESAHSFIRSYLSKQVSSSVADSMRIIYGGSVKGENSEELFKEPNIDGFLVGGASLKPDFLNIIDNVHKQCKL
mmetsp:Transcript_1096/g.1695  ORF Transcript_1096/g.1695 Transcript_1096/m.1695 type:complete len:256 (+) Transcript_1096:26-793(+)